MKKSQNKTGVIKANQKFLNNLEQIQEIKELIYSKINNFYRNPEEKRKEFEEFLNNINNLKQLDLLQKKIKLFS